ncbi:MAG: multidrug effflux MFS transporter [Candidatus Bruticola sp.]
MERSNSRAFLLVLMGVLTAFGPFVTDMYLPTLPTMTTYFSATMSQVQLGLTFSMLGLALGQLGFGPLSDKIGRRSPLLISMLIFVISTLACIFSPNIELFLAMRFFQGIAGAGGIVIARSIAVDKFSGRNLAEALAIAGAINGIAPVAAPIIGGICSDSIGWRGIFVILLAVGLVVTAMCIVYKETLEESRRSSEKWADIMRLFGKVIKRKRFLGYILQMASAQGILFANIASSPFIIQNLHHKSALVFSVYFAINSIAIGLGAAMSVKFDKQEKCITYSCAGMLIGALASTLALNLGASLIVYEIIITATCFAMGMTFTAATTLAMDEVRDYAGAGSAVLGASCYVMGGLVSPLVGLGNILYSVSIIFIAAAAISSLCACLANRCPSTKVESIGAVA